MLIPVSDGPVKVTRIGGSMKLTIPPAFFVVSGLDRDRELEADLYFDGEGLVAKVRNLQDPEKSV